MTDRSDRLWRFVAVTVATFLVLAWTQAGSWGVAYGQTAPGKETPAMPGAATPASFPAPLPATPSAPSTENPATTAQNTAAAVAASSAPSPTPTLVPIVIGVPPPGETIAPVMPESGPASVAAGEALTTGSPDRSGPPITALVGDALIGLGALVVVVTAIRHIIRR